jgi:hypothetical protein
MPKRSRRRHCLREIIALRMESVVVRDVEGDGDAAYGLSPTSKRIDQDP